MLNGIIFPDIFTAEFASAITTSTNNFFSKMVTFARKNVEYHSTANRCILTDIDINDVGLYAVKEETLYR